MDEIEALQLLALQNVEKPDVDYQVRRIKRWYSVTFFTPLKEVDELDFHFILTNYFEHTFSQMPPEELGKLRNQLLLKDHMEEIEQLDEDWIQKELEAEEAKLKQKLKVEQLPDIKMEF